MTTKVWHGFYSEQAAQNHLVYIYATPDDRIVEVTAVFEKVTDAYKPKAYSWPDKVYVGVVTRFIEQREPANYKKREYILDKKPREKEIKPILFLYN